MYDIIEKKKSPLICWRSMARGGTKRAILAYLRRLMKNGLKADVETLPAPFVTNVSKVKIGEER